ncbi:hypothetical protein FQN60_017252 [Etheostoma spectabile]|uniref:Peptide-N-glycosidase F N-terminal domain-containing protein n=1 Tax=Etheostoma spectabile TaxID=54343 RepID=A0A5J5DEZ0_9PERO|nr:hypothetical protein FQN60_017252 [Etheostoma spectabile]
MALLPSRSSVLWLLLLLLVVTAHKSEAAGKVKLIGDRAACESLDNAISLRSSKDSSPDGPEPGDPASSFTVLTLDGEFSYRPGAQRGPLIIHAFSNKSGFLECMWSSESSLTSLVEELPNSTQVLFLSLDDSALSDALWMRDQLHRVAHDRNKEVLSRLHFSPVPVFALGNWIPNVLYYWRCRARGCVFSQAVFKSKSDGCEPRPSVAGAVAWVSEGNCSFFTKVQNMAKFNASGVLVYALPGNPIQDMNCDGDECDTKLDIPAAMVHLEGSVAHALELGHHVYVSFQHTPSPNHFVSIDHQGALAETGWLIYPSFSFINWQAQWFDFYADLQTKLQSPAKVVSVFDKVQMQGEKGAVATVDLPLALSAFDMLELDASLSCPGRRDSSCAHWDHTVQLFVCCDPLGSYCNTELGRWITAFRRYGVDHVELYAVITAHGYDDKRCGEFCITSHNFLINEVFNNTLTFDSAGTPLGCTLRVKDGAVPNEAGTWLYGRGGWCDGLQLNMSQFESNTVIYFGLFEGKDPNPSRDPGYIIMHLCSEDGSTAEMNEDYFAFANLPDEVSEFGNGGVGGVGGCVFSSGGAFRVGPAGPMAPVITTWRYDSAVFSPELQDQKTKTTDRVSFIGLPVRDEDGDLPHACSRRLENLVGLLDGAARERPLAQVGHGAHRRLDLITGSLLSEADHYHVDVAVEDHTHPRGVPADRGSVDQGVYKVFDHVEVVGTDALGAVDHKNQLQGGLSAGLVQEDLWGRGSPEILSPPVSPVHHVVPFGQLSPAGKSNAVSFWI